MPNKRKYNWRHNSLLGSASRSRPDFERIMREPSATLQAKRLAQAIIKLQCELYQELVSRRVNEDRTITELKK